jgi:phosphinothricin acetyltransferase
VSEALSAVVVPLAAEHAEQVLAIHQQGIDEGNATFETSPPAWEAFNTAKLPEHRFAALDENGSVLGWVAASRVSDRCAYAGVVEHSVYVHPAARGRGIASALLKALVDY